MSTSATGQRGGTTGSSRRLRALAKNARDAALEATAGPRDRRATARRHARVMAPVTPTRRLRDGRLRAQVHASQRVRAGLATEWELTGVDPDLLLVEVDARTAATIEAPFVQQRRLVLDASAPVVVWVTASRHVPVGVAGVRRLVEGAGAPVHIVIDDAASVDEWALTLGRAVGHLGPAADPAVHSPALTGSTLRRERVLALVGDSAFDTERLAPIQPERLDVLGGDDVATELPGDRPVLGHYRAAAFVADRPLTPWHVVEAASAGTALLATGETTGRLPEPLAAQICRVEDDPQLRQQAIAHLWQDELIERSALVAAREVRGGHSFARRALDLEALVGRPRHVPRGPAGSRGVSAVISTNRAHELDTVAENMARQSLIDSGEVQVVLVLHGLDVPVREVEARFRERGIEQLVVRTGDSALTLGACLNLGIDASDGSHIAKIDDDNYYGRHYLVDLVDALDHSGAGIAGKWAHYTWLRSTGAVILRFPRSEHRFERLVQGGSILMRGDVARGLRFSDLPRAVDTDLLNRASEAGVATYSSDRFNYVSIRGIDRHAHTWTVEDATFMNRTSRVVFYGDPREHVDV